MISFVFLARACARVFTVCALTGLLAPLLRAVEPVRVVATGGRIGYTFYTPAAANTAFRHRSPHVLGGPVSEMQVGFMDWMYTDKTETANADNDVTIEHAWLERASTGQVVPLTFGGARRLVLPRSSTTPYWLSDAVPSSAWTGSMPARDEIFWLHAKGSIPEGGKIPVGTPVTHPGARFAVYAPANEPGAIDTAGVLPAITGWTTRTDGLPVVFVGRFAGPGHLAVIGIGDSILHGSGDPANPVPTIAGFGFFNRAALDLAGKNAIAMFNLTRHGQTASAWVTPARQSRQTPFLQFANVLVEEYGTNDLGSGGGGNPATILANVEKIWTAARAAGVQKIVRTTLMPRTTIPENTPAADAWATLEIQTPNTGWENGGKRDAINAGLRAAFAAGKIDALLDTLPVLADPADASRWLTNGAAKYVTGDGTHLNAGGNSMLAPHLRAALLALKVDERRTDYARWSASVEWGGADPAPTADPNGDGVSNLLAYAFAFPPLASISGAGLPEVARDHATPGGPWLSLTYRENTTAVDLAYVVESSVDLAAWTTVEIDGFDASSEIVDPDPDGDGVAHLRRVRVRMDVADTRRFLRVRVAL